jgi:DNA-binding transcriptional regulator YiaG
MTPIALRASLAALGMSQSGFARLTGSNTRTVRRWVSGSAQVPLWVPLVLRLMALVPPKRWDPHV